MDTLTNKKFNKLFLFGYRWKIVLSCFILLFVVSGVNQTFTAYFLPVLTEFNWDRVSVSLALSIFMLVSAVTMPIFGKLIDKYGPRRVILVSVPILGLSTILLGTISSLWQYYLLYGLSGISFSGAGMLPTSVLVARWFSKKRGTAMSIVLSGYPFSQIVLVPLSTYLVSIFGWRMSYILLASLVLIIVLPIFLIVVKDDPEDLKLELVGEPPSEPIQNHPITTEMEVSVLDAMKTRSFPLLVVAYFLCGITDIPITAHFVPFVEDLGFPSMIAASVLSLIGMFVLMGTITMGPISDRFGRKNPIVALYLIRVSSLLLLLGRPDIIRLYASALSFGFAYFGMVPLISAWLADNYGRRALGKLNGIMMLAHSAAASIGIYFLGYIFDIYNDYYWGIVVFTLLSGITALCIFLIKEKGAYPLSSEVQKEIEDVHESPDLELLRDG